jgi:hypothetical protein
MIEYEQERERQAFRERVNPYANPFGSLPSDYDLYYNLRGTCKGCRRVTWLCRRDRRCRKYAATPVKGYIAMPTGFQKPNQMLCREAKRLGDAAYAAVMDAYEQ